MFSEELPRGRRRHVSWGKLRAVPDFSLDTQREAHVAVPYLFSHLSWERAVHWAFGISRTFPSDLKSALCFLQTLRRGLAAL